MIIRRLHAQKFRCLNDVDIEFAPGLNIIRGPNEAGKSTVHAALQKVLFERPTKKQANEDDRAWHAESLYKLSLDFIDATGDEWTLIKDFQENSTELRNGDDAFTNFQSIQEKLGSIIGTESGKVFVSTACVSQGAITDIAEGRREIAQSLEEIVTGGENDVYSQLAINKLDGAVRKYLRGYRTNAYRNPGPIASLTQRKSGLKEEVSRSSEIAESRRIAATRHQEIITELAEIGSSLQQKKDALAGFKLAQERRKELDEVVAEEGRLERQLEQIQAAEDEAAAAQTALDEERIATLDDEDLEAIKLLKTRVDIITEAQQHKVMAAPELPITPAQTQAAPSNRRGIVVLCYVLGFVALGAAALLYFMLPESPLLAFGSAALGIVLVLVAILLQVRKTDGNSSVESESEIPVQTEVESTENVDELSDMSRTLDARLNELGFDSWQEFSHHVDIVKRLRGQASKSEVQISALVSIMAKQDIEDQRKIASRKRRDLEEQLEEPEARLALKLDWTEHNNLERAVSKLETTEEALKAESRQLEYHLAAGDDAEADALNARNSLAATEMSLAHELEKLAVYELEGRT